MPEHEIKIRVADWQSDKNELRQIRRRVFIEEQKVPEALEWDEFDETATHFIVSQKNTTTACARLNPDGKIGRMAVLTDYRSRGTGSRLLQFILKTAEQEKLKKVYLHAQLNAVPFYEKSGFTASGDIFYEANIPHREMSKKIC